MATEPMPYASTTPAAPDADEVGRVEDGPLVEDDGDDRHLPAIGAKPADQQRPVAEAGR